MSLGTPPRRVPRPVLATEQRPPINDPHKQLQMLDYWRLCDATVDTAAERLDLNASQSGFSWHGTMTKLDHQVHNIPHIPHHATALSARLRLANGMQVRWVQTNGESYGA